MDDTIHFMSEYKARRAEGETRERSVSTAISVKGRAIITSSFLLSAAFAVLVFSSFVPTIQFGILSSIIMLTAVVGDLVLLPAILLINKEHGSQAMPYKKETT